MPAATELVLVAATQGTHSLLVFSASKQEAALPAALCTRPVVIARVEAETGTQVHLLTGAMEAQYSAWGIRNGFHKPDGMVGDLGARSSPSVRLTPRARFDYWCKTR